jgi:hypothetical protein
LPLGLTKIKDFVRVNPDKKCLKSNFFVIAALEFSSAELGFNNFSSRNCGSMLVCNSVYVSVYNPFKEEKKSNSDG